MITCCVGSIMKPIIKAKDANKLIRKAQSVVGMELETPEEAISDRTWTRLMVIMDNESHPLHNTRDI